MKYISFGEPFYIFLQLREEPVDWLSLEAKPVTPIINDCRDKHGKAGVEITDFSQLTAGEMEEVLSMMSTLISIEQQNQYVHNIYFSF